MILLLFITIVSLFSTGIAEVSKEIIEPNLTTENTCYLPNEEWDFCGCRDATCDDQEPKKCNWCIPGCYCKRGYVRYEGQCIEASRCRSYNFMCKHADQVCGYNEKWYPSHGGCDPTCDAPDRQCRGSIPGCFCLPDHVREHGICIPRQWCYEYKQRSDVTKENTCNLPNEEWDFCGCKDATCNNRVPKKCSWCIPGCYCKEGYVRYEGQCIEASRCPDKVCDYNEKWYPNHGGCDPTCDTPDIHCYGNIAGCYCLPDHVREHGICIPRQWCYEYKQRSDTGDQNVCYGKNEEWDYCGCKDRTCENPFYPKQDCISCVPGCYCKEGFVRRTRDGQCIELEQCTSQDKCPRKNEIHDMCKAGCDGTCANRYPSCPGCVSGCICKDGYVRDHNHNCIPYEWCFYNAY